MCILKYVFIGSAILFAYPSCEKCIIQSSMFSENSVPSYAQALVLVMLELDSYIWPGKPWAEVLF